MHTFKHYDPEERNVLTVFNHHGDYSGEVQITVPRAGLLDRDGKQVTIEVPFAALRALVAEYVRSARIAELEQACADQILFDRVDVAHE